MLKKLISLLTAAVLLVSCANALAAKDYSELIQSIVDSMNQNDRKTSGAPQQTANGAYRAVGMLAAMAYRLDKTGSYSDVIDSSIDTLNRNNRGLSGAPQQTANGLYRCVELLAVIALEMDSSGFYKEYVLGVLEDMDTNNRRASSAVQQEVNGSYRMVDMLTIIAYEKGVDSSLISTVIDSWKSGDRSASGAPQQLVNGLYRCVELVYLIGNKADNWGNLEIVFFQCVRHLDQREQALQRRAPAGGQRHVPGGRDAGRMGADAVTEGLSGKRDASGQRGSSGQITCFCLAG